MDYLESAEDVQITVRRALQELKNHGCTDIKTFFEELGSKDMYAAQEVLAWLGY